MARVFGASPRARPGPSAPGRDSTHRRDNAPDGYASRRSRGATQKRHRHVEAPNHAAGDEEQQDSPLAYQRLSGAGSRGRDRTQHYIVRLRRRAREALHPSRIRQHVPTGGQEGRDRELRFHDLRHDFATRVRRGGAGLDTIAKLLGHSSLEMANRYAHVGDAQLASAVQHLGVEPPIVSDSLELQLPSAGRFTSRSRTERSPLGPRTPQVANRWNPTAAGSGLSIPCYVDWPTSRLLLPNHGTQAGHIRR